MFLDHCFFHFHFHLFPCIFKISSLIFWLTHSLFSSMLFNLHVFVVFPEFFLWLISSFIALWSENIHGVISVCLNLLRFVLEPNMWSIYSMCTWKECMFSCVTLECPKHICQIYLFPYVIQRHRFLVDFLFRWCVHCVSGVWKSYFPISSFMLLTFMCLGVPMLGSYIFTIVISSYWIVPFSVMWFCPLSHYVLCFKVYFLW